MRLIRQVSKRFDTFLKYFEEVSPFLGPVVQCLFFGLLVMSALGFKARVGPSLVCFTASFSSLQLPTFWWHALNLRLFGPLTFSSVGGTQIHATVCGKVCSARSGTIFSIFSELNSVCFDLIWFDLIWCYTFKAGIDGT